MLHLVRKPFGKCPQTDIYGDSGDFRNLCENWAPPTMRGLEPQHRAVEHVKVEHEHVKVERVTI